MHTFPVSGNNLYPSPQYLKGVPSNGAKITRCRSISNNRPQRYKDADALYAFKSRGFDGEIGLGVHGIRL